jgi:hypothetical protein
MRRSKKALRIATHLIDKYVFFVNTIAYMILFLDRYMIGWIGDHERPIPIHIDLAFPAAIGVCSIEWDKFCFID